MSCCSDSSCVLVFLQQEGESFKKLNVISKDEFNTLTPQVPVDAPQDVPPPPMPGELSPVTLQDHLVR